MRYRETLEEMDERLRKYAAAKKRYEDYDTGIWSSVPDAPTQKQAALNEMWETANGPAPSELRRRKIVTEKEFHAARRMFMVCNGTVLIAPVGCPYTHIEWLLSLFFGTHAEAMIRNHPRGYVLGKRLMIYKGDSFDHYVDPNAAIVAIDVFTKLYGSELKEIGFGAKHGPTQPWEPKILYEIDDYLTKVAAAIRNRLEINDGNRN